MASVITNAVEQDIEVLEYSLFHLLYIPLVYNTRSQAKRRLLCVGFCFCFVLVALGIELRALCVIGKHFTTEIHPTS